MNKQNFKQKMAIFSTGFVAAAVLTTATSAWAAPLQKQITAFFNGTKIYVDGRLVQSTDAKGNKIEPLVYEGTTYLPVRAVAEAFNSKVTWDAPGNSIYIGKVNATDHDVSLSSLDFLSESQSIKWGHLDWQSHSSNKVTAWSPEDDKDNTGTNYNDGLKFELVGSGTGATHGLAMEREYLLNQKYKSFSGSFVLHYDSRSSEEAHATLKVYGDDQLLYTSDKLEKGVLPIDFDVNVSNISKLKIVITNTDSDMDYKDKLYFGIVNAGFKK
ncbi:MULTISPECIES: NPCBM/NEW2 domain-containing protein [Paenibacillus]|uniref:Glycosyl hydrolase family 98 putative carbohydrate-binding module domain-containing protein n=1 Tax=Paenibacillus woosongensis TaxID=307580 RepID=A0A7X2Z1V7_9BACL|nr:MULTISPECIES: NPCBM/NEW2 domain-containing protein [Paenibacillus]MUG45326.1 hypothetical protein [Paenibacillus woosongensis]